MSFPSLPNPFSSSSSSSSSSNPSTPSSTISAAESTALKNKIIETIQMEANTQNAKFLMQKVNENCFTHCISNPPSTSLSRTESSCVSSCMEKYLQAWNVANATYINRLSREAPAGSGGGLSMDSGGGGEGKEIY